MTIGPLLSSGHGWPQRGIIACYGFPQGLRRGWIPSEAMSKIAYALDGDQNESLTADIELSAQAASTWFLGCPGPWKG